MKNDEKISTEKANEKINTEKLNDEEIEKKQSKDDDDKLINEILGMKITSLKKKAKEYNIPNFSVMNKADLVNYVLVEKGNEEGKIYGFGTLDIVGEGSYGFLRNTSVGPDVYVSISQIKRFFLRNGDMVFGELRVPIASEKNYGILKVLLVNGDLAKKSLKRPFFDNLI